MYGTSYSEEMIGFVDDCGMEDGSIARFDCIFVVGVVEVGEKHACNLSICKYPIFHFVVFDVLFHLSSIAK